MLSTRSFECNAATPFVEWLPIMARLAILTIFGLDSSMMETFAIFSFCIGKKETAEERNLLLISKIISI